MQRRSPAEAPNRCGFHAAAVRLAAAAVERRIAIQGYDRGPRTRAPPRSLCRGVAGPHGEMNAGLSEQFADAPIFS
jgi:hypothetical protein